MARRPSEGLPQGSPTTTTEVIPVFVYGTLRKGQGNYLWSESAVLHCVEGVTTTGQLFHVASFSRKPQRIFPVADFRSDGTITGDLLYFEVDSEITEQVFQMEMGAGYEPLWIVVTDPEGVSHDAVGFHYARAARGPRIESGNWLAKDAYF